METQQLVREIEELPEEARREVAQFLTQLKLRLARTTPLTEAEVAYWTDPAVFGVTADDPSRVDSVAYVRELRQQQWRGK